MELWLALLLLALVTPLMTDVERVIVGGLTLVCVVAGGYHLIRSWWR